MNIWPITSPIRRKIDSKQFISIYALLKSNILFNSLFIKLIIRRQIFLLCYRLTINRFKSFPIQHPGTSIRMGAIQFRVITAWNNFHYEPSPNLTSARGWKIPVKYTDLRSIYGSAGRRHSGTLISEVFLFTPLYRFIGPWGALFKGRCLPRTRREISLKLAPGPV